MTITKKTLRSLLFSEHARDTLQSAGRYYRQYLNKERPVIVDYIDLMESDKALRETDCAFSLSVKGRKESCAHELIGPKNTMSGTYHCEKCGLTVYLVVIKEAKKEEDTKPMCTVDEERIIKMTVEEFLQQGKMFTSVDVANKIKLSGAWIRNHEVAGYLRGNVLGIARMLMMVYKQTMIPVTLADGSVTETYLYHPVNTDANDYTDRDQRALDPITANHPKSASLHIQSIPPVMSNPVVVAPPDPDPSFDIDPWRVASA
jgi:hypothetical protein